MRQIRLLVAPLLGLLLFSNETYRSYRSYSHSGSTCFWWGNIAAFDAMPLNKTVAFGGQKPVTDCEFQQQVIDRFGPRPSIRVLVISGFPAFVTSSAFATALGR